MKNEEIYGSPASLRVKWSCKRCNKRNDNALRTPPCPSEVFVCFACKKATVIHFKVEIDKPTTGGAP